MEKYTLEFLRRHEKTLAVNDIDKFKISILRDFDGKIDDLLDTVRYKVFNSKQCEIIRIRYFISCWNDDNPLPADIETIQQEYNFRYSLQEWIDAVKDSYNGKDCFTALYHYKNPVTNSERYFVATPYTTIQRLIEYAAYDCDEGDDLLPSYFERIA